MPCDNNFSDDEQAFLTYYIFYWTVLKDGTGILSEDILSNFYISIYRHWKFTKVDFDLYFLFYHI